MQEQHRIEYLKAMGIHLWMPHSQLENSPEPRWLAPKTEIPATGQKNPGSKAEIKGGNAAGLLSGGAEEDVPAQQLAHGVAERPSQDVVPAVSTKDQSESISLPTESGNAAVPTPEDVSPDDLETPRFELHFSLWPCGLLWVSSGVSDIKTQSFQAAVSYYLTRTVTRQLSEFVFRWPYLETSHEDQSRPVALRALQAQWAHIRTHEIKGWVATDPTSADWLQTVSDNEPLCVLEKNQPVFSSLNKARIFRALQVHNRQKKGIPSA